MPILVDWAMNYIKVQIWATHQCYMGESTVNLKVKGKYLISWCFNETYCKPMHAVTNPMQGILLLLGTVMTYLYILHQLHWKILVGMCRKSLQKGWYRSDLDRRVPGNHHYHSWCCHCHCHCHHQTQSHIHWYLFKEKLAHIFILLVGYVSKNCK